MERLYLVTRRDLPAGAQASQLVHAALAFASQYDALVDLWMRESNTIVLLTVENELELQKLMDKASDQDIRFAAFQEPDLNNQFTAVVLEPDGKSLVRSLPLALSD